MEFKGQIAIITGAARGIGNACAWAFVQRGAIPILVDIDGNENNKAVSKLQEQGLNALGITADISKNTNVEGMVHQVMDKYGRIDVLVNNAFFGGGYAPVTETSEEIWNRANDVNMKGAFLCAKAVAKVMINQQSGKIINISSLAGVVGSISLGIQYSASKAGIIGLTKGLAGELAPFGINVNCITPGVILTKSLGEQSGWTQEKRERFIKSGVPIGRLGQPEDIAGVVVFLASKDASYIVGQVISVDGGALLNTVAKREALYGG